MFNININWIKLIKENLPNEYVVTSIVDYLRVCISPFIAIHNEFKDKFEVFVFKIRFTGQVNYLTRRLNDKFSPVSGGIQIINGNTVVKNYLYMKSELLAPIYLHKNWKATINYVVDDYVAHNNKIYKCLVNNINFNPSTQPAKWQYVREIVFLKRAVEFDIQYNFIVRVPSSLVFDMNQMKATIDYYRLAGKRYKIILY